MLSVLCSLLIVLFAGCDLFEAPVKAEEGVGYVSLSVGGAGAARTITPVFGTDVFAEFTVEIFTAGTTSNPAVSHQRIAFADINKPIALAVGAYDFYVKAYTNAGDSTAAAEGNVKNVAVTAGQTISQNIHLGMTDEAILAAMGSGSGSFGWDIGFSADRLEMTVSKYADGTVVGSAQTSTTSPWSGSIADLPVGFYRVLFRQYSGTNPVLERREILHIYEGRESRFDVVFSAQLATVFLVTNGSNSGAGSLRQAISDAPDGSVIVIDPGVGTIALTARLELLANRNITIEGNGVTITRAGTWTTVDTNTQLMNLPDNATVVIRRVHFKDGRAYRGGAIFSSGANLTLESCIFSGNQNSRTDDWGGAIYTSTGTLTVLGCTFYNNATPGSGGAIYVMSGTVTLAGNLFYGNTAPTTPIIRRAGTVTSLGYNVVDVALGTGETQSGFAAVTGDKTITDLPISPFRFMLVPNSGAANVISALPENYPTHDFYGNPIPRNNAAAGAVQSSISGYDIGLSVNDSGRGSALITSAAQADGSYTVGSTVTLTAAAQAGFYVYWLVDGARSGETNTLQLTMDKSYIVQAVFYRTWEVTAATSAAASASAASGTIGWAVFNALTGDTIELNVPGKIITLTARIALYAGRNITIEGNSTVITLASTWTATSESQLMNLPSGTTATIRQVHFKDGRATDYGAAIRNQGNLTLESCVFSGNQISRSGAYGGAMYNGVGTLNVFGCTFYNNACNGYGGAIYVNSGTVTLAGNLFYGNTATTGPIIFRGTNSNISSLSYNVVDVAFGTTNSATTNGFAAVTGDTTFADAGFADNTTLPFTADDGAFVPAAVGTLRTLIPANPSADFEAVFPAFDFNGNARKRPGAPGAVEGE